MKLLSFKSKAAVQQLHSLCVAMTIIKGRGGGGAVSSCTGPEDQGRRLCPCVHSVLRINEELWAAEGQSDPVHTGSDRYSHQDLSSEHRGLDLLTINLITVRIFQSVSIPQAKDWIISITNHHKIHFKLNMIIQNMVFSHFSSLNNHFWLWFSCFQGPVLHRVSSSEFHVQT